MVSGLGGEGSPLVVLASLAYRTAPASLEPRSAFPAHNLLLLGIGNTLWVFRLVGVWWLAAAGWQLIALVGRDGGGRGPGLVDVPFSGV